MAKYKVNINQVWSEEVIVNAKTAAEAKKKAWEKWKAKKKNQLPKADVTDPEEYWLGGETMIGPEILKERKLKQKKKKR